MSRIYLVRHGQAGTRKAYDSLSELGKRQSRLLGEYFHEAMRLDARAAVNEHNAPVNRRWLPCDVKVVETWVAGRLPYDGESWPAFLERVSGCRSRLEQAAREGDVAVFTSATPIGVWTAMAMDIFDERAMRLAGALRNASCTVMRLRGGQLRLDAFNTIPHLSAPELRTYR